ncbi:probable lysophospholipase BODYGUARD 4 [Rhododendron vialii]|uniref:probable lysophospholipase BODYGUARD 4 n=1 Tax=Rhododendron vialii TaxID=182163 RepID=UPI00265D9992|nr:probable lysophospholipase BODYGUARD 4 [Rhododendron vialii]
MTMPIVSPIFSGKWPGKTAEFLVSAMSSIVFLFLDFLDILLCDFFKIVDEFFEGKAGPCYCHNRGEGRAGAVDERGSEASETLYGRKNVFREMGSVRFPRKSEGFAKNGGGNGIVGNRWSDCGCESCVSWMSIGDQRLHVVVKEPSEDAFGRDCSSKPTENVIFLHGFLSSSLIWTEMVFPNLSEPTKRNYRLFALDLLGFGRSPKPRDCLYTLRDHLEMVEKSVIDAFQLSSFHLVAHSMGCIVAVALAAKHSKSVKSITLLAPPYFLSPKDGASLTALRGLTDRKLWPPLLFGSAVMAWYEHLGRGVCFLFCRNHRAWEWILKLLTRRRDLHFMFTDMTRHTHHSAWHTMHNVICGGAKSMDEFLESLRDSKAKIHVIQGAEDHVVRVECSSNIKMKVPQAEVEIIANADHNTIILNREREFTRNLERIWASTADNKIAARMLF